MEIRKAKPDDINEILALIILAITDMEKDSIFQWDSIYPNSLIIHQDVKDQTLFVLIDNNIIKGIITLNTDQPQEYSELNWIHNHSKIIVIHRLCVHPSYKGAGLAKKLLSFTIDYCRKNAFSVIRLDAYTENKRALALYEHFGYECVGQVTFRKGVFNCYEKGIDAKRNV